MKLRIYDLDETVINSKHRYKNLPCGSIDLDYWIANSTPEKIAKDSLLPLAAQYKKDIACPQTVVVVATARQCMNHDYLYVAKHLGAPNHFISRRAGDKRSDSLLKVLGIQRLLDSKGWHRSEEHTSELQSHSDLVCRLLLEKKKNKIKKKKKNKNKIDRKQHHNTKLSVSRR